MNHLLNNNNNNNNIVRNGNNEYMENKMYIYTSLCIRDDGVHTVE